MMVIKKGNLEAAFLFGEHEGLYWVNKAGWPIEQMTDEEFRGLGKVVKYCFGCKRFVETVNIWYTDGNPENGLCVGLCSGCYPELTRKTNWPDENDDDGFLNECAHEALIKLRKRKDRD